MVELDSGLMTMKAGFCSGLMTQKTEPLDDTVCILCNNPQPRVRMEEIALSLVDRPKMN